MSDIIDDAQVAEAMHLKAALSRPRRPGPAPVSINAVACCADCARPIAPARVAALPGVGLCVACQGKRERAEI